MPDAREGRELMARVTYVQPDGGEKEAVLRGDDRGHCRRELHTRPAGRSRGAP